MVLTVLLRSEEHLALVLKYWQNMEKQKMFGLLDRHNNTQVSKAKQTTRHMFADMIAVMGQELNWIHQVWELELLILQAGNTILSCHNSVNQDRCPETFMCVLKWTHCFSFSISQTLTFKLLFQATYPIFARGRLTFLHIVKHEYLSIYLSF